MTITFREDQTEPLTWRQLDDNFRGVLEAQTEVLRQVSLATDYASQASGYREEAQQAAINAEAAAESQVAILRSSLADPSQGASTVGATLQSGSSGTVQDAINASSTDKALRADLSGAGGSEIIGFNGLTLSSYLKMQFADVQDFGADPTGAADSTAAFMAAAATGRTVHPSALRTGGKAVYRVALTNLPANTRIIGDGANSELVPLTSASPGAIVVNSSSPTTFIDNLIFANFVLRGSVVADGFAEHSHLLILNGVRNVLVENVQILGFRGDGCYLGSGSAGDTERHNFNVTIRRCLFDGLNNDNRNGLSIIDGSNVLVENNTFQNCARSNMPGAIDIEPNNNNFHIINGISIVRNKFRNIGGNLGTVSLFMGSSVVPDPKDIRINDNDFADSVTTTLKADVFIGTSRAVGSGTPWSFIQIIGNNGRNGCRALDIRAIKGIRIEGNNWVTYTQPSRFGIANSALDAPLELYHANNRYIGNASQGGAGLQVGNIDHLTNDGNSWEECGNGAVGSAGIEYLAGACTRIKHYRNNFKSAGGKMLQGILYNSSGKSPATDTQIGDTFLNNLSSQFVAYETDMKWNTYTPVIAGGSTAGSGTYTVQYGRFTKQGNIVKYAVHIEATSHTGTGLLRISLPLNAQTQTDVTFPSGAATSIGLDGAGSICLLNSGAVAGGVTGAVGLHGYKTAAANTMVQLIIPAGAFSIFHEGTYVAS